jgi:hypothetical protein
MGYKVEVVTESQTKKRFDYKIKMTPFLAEDWEFNMRILSTKELSSKEVNEIIDETCSSVEKWGKTKKGKSLTCPIARLHVSVYILKSDKHDI